MLPKLKEIFEAIEYLYAKTGWPSWILKWVLGISLAVILFLLLLYAIDWIFKLWVESLKPRFYDAEGRKRTTRRQRFAEHLVSEIARVNRKEDWDDYHFTELEAEVEAEGYRRTFRHIPLLKRSRGGLRREKSLSNAIKNSSERIIQLEGDPGSGKSVALRHLALKMAKNASKSRSLKSIIPLYLNLKELSRDHKREDINRSLIESFVLKTLKRTNDRNIEEFLEKEFSLGIEDGTWFFLFDSFDEIPEVLSSTEEDDIVKSYAEAISDFLGGLSKCRGVVASRHYRGPGKSGWAKFRVLELSEARRNELVKNADLDSKVEAEVKGQLAMASDDIRELSKNPMLLGLLCIHLKAGNAFPENAHTVLATYLDARLERDRDRLKQRFNLETKDIREVAEKIAFCMAADHGMGLTPSRQDLVQSLAKLNMRVADVMRFNKVLDGLEYIKLGRSENDDVLGESRLFTFAHRRFQEYFATCVVLREPDRVTARELLRDARWRETTVVMFQTQPLERLSPLLNESQLMLYEMINSLPNKFRIEATEFEEDTTKEAKQNKGSSRKDEIKAQFPWPPDSIHLLSLLQDGFGRRMSNLPNQIRKDIGKIVISASLVGSPFDQTWALEVAGASDSQVLVNLIRLAFADRRQKLQDIAYRQTSHLSGIPNDVTLAIHNTLVNLYTRRRLSRDYLATCAHVSRLDNAKAFLSTLYLLKWLPRIDVTFHILIYIAFLILFSHIYTSSGFNRFAMTTAGFLLLSFFLRHKADSWGFNLRAWLIPQMIGTELFKITNSYIISIGVGGASSIVLSWASFTLLLASKGYFSRPILWPFAPFAALFAILQWATRDLWRDEKKSSIIQGLTFILFALALTIAIYKVPIMGTVLGVLILIVFTAGAGCGGVYLILWISDGIKWRQTAKEMSKVNAQEFARQISQFKTGYYRCRVIENARLHNLLRSTQETRDFVCQLAFALSWQKAETQIKIGEVNFSDWYYEVFEKKSFLRLNWDERLIDELFLLQTQLLTNDSEQSIN
jgi:hypothetical protein